MSFSLCKSQRDNDCELPSEGLASVAGFCACPLLDLMLNTSKNLCLGRLTCLLIIDCFVMIFAGGIVALGKFDALHIGHRELAIQASKVGAPSLLSFVGMAEILGWEPR